MKQEEDENKNSNKILKIFNYIGGTLIFFGVSYFIMDNWDVLGLVLRLLSSLGVACGFFYVAILLSRENKFRPASAVFFILAGLIFPLGISELLDAFGLLINAQMDNIIISGVCFSIFWATYTVYRRDVLLLFSLVFGSYFYIVTTQYLGEHLRLLSNNFFYYQMLVLGLFYAALGYCLREADTGLSGILYFFGDLMVLVTVFSLGGWWWDTTPVNYLWQWGTPLVLIVNFMLSVYLRSRAYLYNSTIFLLIFITSLSAKFSYLFGTFGWPLILIVAGFGLMIVGYGVAYMHKRIQK